MTSSTTPSNFTYKLAIVLSDRYAIGSKNLVQAKYVMTVEIRKISRRRPRLVHDAEFGHFTLLGGVYMRKLAPARVSHWDDFLISYRVYMMTGSFHILLFNGTFHIDKIHVWFKIENITHALPVPVYRQTDFTPKWVVVSRLHDFVPE